MQQLEARQKLDTIKYDAKIKELEDEIDQVKAGASADLQDVQTKSEEALAQLRNFYEMEKERLDSRLAEERDRFNLKLANMQDDYEERIR